MFPYSEHQIQCAEHLQAINKASATNECKINLNALSVNINAESINRQFTEHQQPMNSVSTTNDRNINAQSINNQCVLHQQPMCSALTANAHSTRIPYAWFLQSEVFAVRLPLLSFCVEPKAKSQNPSSQKVTFLKVCGGTVLKDPSPSSREVILHLTEPSSNRRGGIACGGSW